jgi:hypothetical protein
MAERQHPTSLMTLLVEVQIEITGHLAATLERPMDDLRSLRATCSSMHGICGDPAVSRCMAVDRCRHGARSSNDLINYFTLLARLTQVDNQRLASSLGYKSYSQKTTAPDHASTISPMLLMSSILWWPFWSPYSSVGTMAMLMMTTL